MYVCECFMTALTGKIPAKAPSRSSAWWWVWGMSDILTHCTTSSTLHLSSSSTSTNTHKCNMSKQSCLRVWLNHFNIFIGILCQVSGTFTDKTSIRRQFLTDIQQTAEDELFCVLYILLFSCCRLQTSVAHNKTVFTIFYMIFHRIFNQKIQWDVIYSFSNFRVWYRKLA